MLESNNGRSQEFNIRFSDRLRMFASLALETGQLVPIIPYGNADRELVEKALELKGRQGRKKGLTLEHIAIAYLRYFSERDFGVCLDNALEVVRKSDQEREAVDFYFRRKNGAS